MLLLFCRAYCEYISYVCKHLHISRKAVQHLGLEGQWVAWEPSAWRFVWHNESANETEVEQAL
jgi:hypothetical protein